MEEINMGGSTVIRGKGADNLNHPILVDNDGKLIISPDTTGITIDGTVSGNQYLTDVNGAWIAARGSLIGYTLTKDVQSSVQYSDEQQVTWAASSPQYNGKQLEFTLPDGDIQAKYFVVVNSGSDQTNLSMYVTNEQTVDSQTKYSAINNSTVITVPKSSNTVFTATAWNSCFTSIGGILADESGDLNDTNGPDVPFPFAAQDDAIYFGNSVPFDRIRLNITTAGNYTGVTTWEYWNGSAWSALTIQGDTTNATTHTGAKSFTTTGYKHISFLWPSDWTSYDIASDPIAAYWVRCRISSFTSAVATPIFQQGWYKRVGQVNTHSYLIEGVYGGSNCVIKLENDTALDAYGQFTATVLLKRF